MTGLKMVLPTSFTDTSLSVLHDDAILSSGSLMLVDAIHSANPWASGVPTNGFAIPNIAWKEAAALLGSGTQSSLAGQLIVSGSINNNTKGKMERSGKGGLHVIVSQATALTSSDGVVANLPQAIRTYIKNNPTHSYYFSAWDYVTRIQPGTVNSANGIALYDISAGNTGALLVMPRTDVIVTTSGASSGSRVAPSLNAAGARYISQAVPSSSLNLDTQTEGGAIWGAPSSTYNAAVLASRNNLWPSSIMYRYYLEDLTVSGRSFAAVDALDYALYQAAVTTSGGRYNGDTFTSPTTVP